MTFQYLGNYINIKKVSLLIYIFPAKNKTDLESLLHQPDPSLTVQELPQNPKISFRKGSHILDEEAIASEESTEAPLFQG